MAQMTQAEVFIKFGVATDIHLGAHEPQGLQSDRYLDAFTAFEDVLQKAEENMIDFLIIGGDLFHERSPSEITLLKCVTLLKKFVYGDTQNQIEISSSPVDINFLSPDHNIRLPIFTINGNHDNTYTDQDENVSILDILHQSKLVNYIGKILNQNQVSVKPVIIHKKGIRIALYGIGYMKDYQFNKLLKDNKIILEDISEKNCNILIIHQNRYKGSHYQSERDFLDPIQFKNFKISLLIWGHEHEPKDILEDLGSYQVFSPGSTVATSLIEAEGKIKQMGLFTISKNNLTFASIKLTDSHRPIILKYVELKEMVRNKPDNVATQEYAERQLFDTVHDTLKQYFAQNQYRHKKPLLKVKVDSTGFDIMKMRFFETKFRDQVANPDKIFQFIKRHEVKDNNMKQQELKKINQAFNQKFEDKIEQSNADCNYKIQQKLKTAKLTLIKPNEIQNILEQNGLKKSDNAVELIQEQMVAKYKKLFYHDQLGEMNQYLNKQRELEDQIVYTLKKYINEDFQNDLSNKHPDTHINNSENDVNKICDKFIQYIDSNLNFDQMQQFHIKDQLNDLKKPIQQEDEENKELEIDENLNKKEVKKEMKQKQSNQKSKSKNKSNLKPQMKQDIKQQLNQSPIQPLITTKVLEEDNFFNDFQADFQEPKQVQVQVPKQQQQVQQKQEKQEKQEKQQTFFQSSFQPMKLASNNKQEQVIQNNKEQIQQNSDAIKPSYFLSQMQIPILNKQQKQPEVIKKEQIKNELISSQEEVSSDDKRKKSNQKKPKKRKGKNSKKKGNKKELL